MSKLTKAQITTLTTIIANGGEMNGFAGQKGFYCNSLPVLVRKGFLTAPLWCDGTHGIEVTTWHATEGTTIQPQVACTVEHTELVGQKGGKSCYSRVSITDAGRAALAEAKGEPTPAPKKTRARKPVEKVAPVITVSSGDKVRKNGVLGRVLEVGKRAGVVVLAVAFGATLEWVTVAELVVL